MMKEGKIYCPGTECKKLTVEEFKELYPGEKLPNHRAGFLVPQNLSEMYLLPPKRLLELMVSDDPPTVSPYLNYMQMYMGDLDMKPAPFVRSHSIVPPMCFYFNVLGKHDNYSKKIQKTRFLADTGLGHYWPKLEVLDHFSQSHKQMTELRIRGIRLVPGWTRLDAQLSMGQISVHSRDNFNNPFLSGVSVEMGKNIILRGKLVYKKSLPYPYETDCHDYATEIEERSTPGPTNRMVITYF
ncbi:hypothetical protein TNCV_2760481 [Trichonephila clavipes]|nr:hypothetical protein TNCV_2760481 [Trichonephila clavipes]